MATERAPNPHRIDRSHTRLVDAVGGLIRDVTQSLVLPNYVSGQPNLDIDSKVESALARGLRLLLPHSGATGEESAEGQTAKIEHALRDGEPTWVIDPIDGSRNFRSGIGPFTTMVVLRADGRSILSAIYDPIQDVLALAAADHGITLNGRPTSSNHSAAATHELVGLVPLQYLPEPIKSQAQQGLPALHTARSGHRCVGREYLDLAEGNQDFAIFWQTKPWDHLPGLLLAEECGMAIGRFDDTAVDLFDGTKGMIVARSAEVLTQVRDALIS